MNRSTDWQVSDVLSPAGMDVIQRQSDAYTRLTPKEPGTPEVAALLKQLAPEQLFTRPLRSTDHGRAVLAGLWLYHDFLDASHAISQELHDPDGSFWHAIMHRREGDFSNAKYWYARCRHHPTFGAIAAEGRSAIAGLAQGSHLEQLVNDQWDPDGFVDVVEAVHRKPHDPLYGAAVALQRAEWRVLLGHCARAAVGAA